MTVRPFKTGVLRPEKVFFTSMLVLILKVQTLIRLPYVKIFVQPLSVSKPLCFDTNL